MAIKVPAWLSTAWATIKDRFKAFFATKTGKIVALVVVVVFVSFISGGVGNVVGCVKQKALTDIVSLELKSKQDELDKTKAALEKCTDNLTQVSDEYKKLLDKAKKKGIK